MSFLINTLNRGAAHQYLFTGARLGLMAPYYLLLYTKISFAFERIVLLNADRITSLLGAQLLGTAAPILTQGIILIGQAVLAYLLMRAVLNFTRTSWNDRGGSRFLLWTFGLLTTFYDLPWLQEDRFWSIYMLLVQVCCVCAEWGRLLLFESAESSISDLLGVPQQLLSTIQNAPSTLWRRLPLVIRGVFSSIVIIPAFLLASLLRDRHLPSWNEVKLFVHRIFHPTAHLEEEPLLTHQQRAIIRRFFSALAIVPVFALAHLLRNSQVPSLRSIKLLFQKILHPRSHVRLTNLDDEAPEDSPPRPITPNLPSYASLPPLYTEEADQATQAALEALTRNDPPPLYESSDSN